MIAKLGKQVSNAKNMGQEKETTDTYNVVGYKAGEFKELITCRVYMGRSSSASVVYASIWISGKGFYTSGRGSAGGYGYHKISAAIGEAISSADIKLYGSPYIAGRDGGKVDYKKEAHIGGIGDYAIQDALSAIAIALGYKKHHLVRG